MEKFRTGSLREKYSEMKKTVPFYAYYEWLNIIPERLSRTLAYLINLDGWNDCERLDEAPSYFNANQTDIAKAVGVSRQTVAGYLEELKRYKLIDFLTDRPGKKYSKETYICLFNENIEQLRIIYHFREEYPDELFKYVKKLNIDIKKKEDMYVKKFNIAMLRNYTYICKEIIHTYVKFYDKYNNNNSTNSSKREDSTSISVLGEKENIKRDNLSAEQVFDDNFITFKSLTIPRNWANELSEMCGEKGLDRRPLTEKKLSFLEKYLREHPIEKDWALKTWELFLEKVNQAYMHYNSEKDRPVAL